MKKGFLSLLALLSINSYAEFNYILPKEGTTPLQQNIYWEQQANVKKFRRQIEPVDMKLIPYNKKDVQSWVVGNGQMSQQAQNAPQKFYDKKNKIVYFPLHPRNESHEIHWAKKDHLLKGKFRERIKKSKVLETASRTLYLIDEDSMIAVKPPTDRMVNADGIVTRQDIKSHLHIGIRASRERSTVVSLIDSHINKDPQLHLMKEIGWFRLHKKIDPSRNGFMLRDISILDNGNYYLPGFSIPYAGKEIAEMKSVDSLKYWQEHYAYRLGRLKGKLLIRYGIQMVTPNSQNFLIEMDSDYNPTGTIAMRDLEDTWIVPAVANVIIKAHNLDQKLFRHWKSWDNNYNFLRPFWANSVYMFNDSEDPRYHIGFKPLSTTWFRSHLQGYLDEINESLDANVMPLHPKKMWFSKKVTKYKKHLMKFQNYPGIKEETRFTKPVLDFLTSPEGEKKLREFHQRISKI